MSLPVGIVKYLHGRFENGDAVLFTGAGFSTQARNLLGGTVPSTGELKRILWKLVYPAAEFEESSTLPDLFELARTRAQSKLQEHLDSAFTVDRVSIPEWYRVVFSQSWQRVFTLNIDDLAEAAILSDSGQARGCVSISPASYGAQPDEGQLQIVHLNGRVRDKVDSLTFTQPQYGRRVPGVDSLYQQAAVDVLARPIVFIGTELEEPPLWQHIELRRTAHGRDLRRRSFLVTPRLSRARKDYLERELHVEHVPMSAEEFAEQVLRPAAPGSRKYFEERGQPTLWDSTTGKVPLVSQLALDELKPPAGHEYLLGFNARWSDIKGGLAAPREFEDVLLTSIRQSLTRKTSEKDSLISIVTGTAGSGKTTALMRVALRLSADGVDVAWFDQSMEISPAKLRSIATIHGLPRVVVIDDADRFGNELHLLARDLSQSPKRSIILLGVRSGRVERLADRLRLQHVPFEEFVVPFLTDADIEALLGVLERNNRLGKLTGKPRKDQIEEFRSAERGSRQLLVAMLRVTLGRKFEERIQEELEQLSGPSKYVYAMVAIATAYRFGLSRDQILLGIGAPTNESLQVIEDLSRRLLIVPQSNGSLKVRHRVVGEKVVDFLITDRSLLEPLSGLALAMAAKLGPLSHRSSATYRNIRVLMNHDWLQRALGVGPAKQFLADLEQFMAWDHHYWLQRGSLELECGDESLAELFLSQAAGIEPTDFLVQTELGYLRTHQAVREPNALLARELWADGTSQLRAVAGNRTNFDPHQYDILGRMTLKWIRRGDITATERTEELGGAIALVEEGRKKHPADSKLRELYVLLVNEKVGIGGVDLG